MDDVCGDIYEKLSALSHYLDRIIDSLEEQAALLFEEDISVWMERARGRMGDKRLEEAVSPGRAGRPGTTRKNSQGEPSIYIDDATTVPRIDVSD